MIIIERYDFIKKKERLKEIEFINSKENGLLKSHGISYFEARKQYKLMGEKMGLDLK